MKLVSPKELEHRRKTAEDSLRQVLHPHRVMKDKELFLCWIQRLERAYQKVKGKGPKAQKLFDKLVDDFHYYCQKADDDLATYREYCKAAGKTPEAIDVQDCWCVRCTGK